MRAYNISRRRDMLPYLDSTGVTPSTTRREQIYLIYPKQSLPPLGEPRRALHDDDHELVLRADARGAQRLRVVAQNVAPAHEPDALRLAVVVLRHERPQLPDGARLRDGAAEVARGKGLAPVRPERDLEGRRRRRLRRALALEEGADRVAEAQAAAERAVDEAHG